MIRGSKSHDDEESEDEEEESAQSKDEEEESAHSDDKEEESAQSHDKVFPDFMWEQELKNSHGEWITILFPSKHKNSTACDAWDSEEAWKTVKLIYLNVQMLSIWSRATEFAEVISFDETNGDLLPLELFRDVVYKTKMNSSLLTRWDRLIGVSEMRSHYEAAKTATKKYSLFCACFSTMINDGEPFDPCSDGNNFASMKRFIEVVKSKDSTNLKCEFQEYLSTLSSIFHESETMPEDPSWTEEYTLDSHANCIRQLAELYEASEKFSIWSIGIGNPKHTPTHSIFGNDTILPVSLEQWSALICDRPYVVIEKGERINETINGVICLFRSLFCIKETAFLFFARMNG